MLSMCGLLCRMLRGWRHNEAVMLMAKALSQPQSSILVQNINNLNTSGTVTVNEPSSTSIFCQNSSEGSVGQLIWRDNNKQAVIIIPRQRVDLKRWTLFLASSQSPLKSNSQNASDSTDEKFAPDGGASEVSGTVTILLEASYRETENEITVDHHVMVEHLSQPYAWKARETFGVIVTTTPPQLLAMIQAFFNNALIIDDDFLITKIITVDLVGEASTLDDPLSIPESVTPGPWNSEKSGLTQLEIARSLSPTSGHVYQLPAIATKDLEARSNSLHPPPLSNSLRHQSSESATEDTSTTLNPQSSSDSDKHPSSLDPQSSYDSVSDYPTSDTDDVPCNVYNFYPRGWAISGAHVVSGQPLSVRGVLNHFEGKQYKKPCSIVTNPMEDLWQDPEDNNKSKSNSCAFYRLQPSSCLNGPAKSQDDRTSLLKVEREGAECVPRYRCISGPVFCRNLQAEPGLAERQIVREAAECYQKALSSSQEQREWVKKSFGSSGEEDLSLNDFSFSGRTQDRAIVTREPKRYPVRIKSEADLSRATSLIKDNLANIVENYLVKQSGSPDFQYQFPKVQTENPTLKLPCTFGRAEHQVFMNGRVTEIQVVRQDQLVHVKEIDSEPSAIVPIVITEIKTPTHDMIKAPILEMLEDSCSVMSGKSDKKIQEFHDVQDDTIKSMVLYNSSISAEVQNDKGITNTKPFENILAKLTADSSPEEPYLERGNKQKSKVHDANIVAVHGIRPKEICKSSSKNVKKLVKSEELALPTMKREGRIDIPVGLSIEIDVNNAPKEECSSDTKQRPELFKTEREELLNLSSNKMKTDEGYTNSEVKVDEKKTAFDKDISDQKTEGSNAKSQGKKNVSPGKKEESIVESPVLLDVTYEEEENISVVGNGIPTDNGDIVGVTEECSSSTATSDKDITKDLLSESTCVSSLKEKIVETSADEITHDVQPVSISKETEIVDMSKASITDNINKPKGDNWAGISIILEEKSLEIVDDTEPGAISDQNHIHVREKESSEVFVTDNVDDVEKILQANKPKCLKDKHKLDTKSSTTSESSFESLPYRMLSSQPESLTDDIVIELTKAPLDSEKLKVAKQELLRLERMNAISMASQYLTESKDEFSPEDKCKSICYEADVSHEEVMLDFQGLSSSIQEEDQNQEMCNSSLFDSGVEGMQSEQTSSVGSSITKILPSPVESTTESGFSSLKEPLPYENLVTEEEKLGNQDGVSLSKSKDSLDLTDTDKFPGTDTLSDDMETLSSNAGDLTLVESGPVSKEGSARGSISDNLNHENGHSKMHPEEQTNIDLDSFGIPNNYQTVPCYAHCDVHTNFVSGHESQKYHALGSQSLEMQESVFRESDIAESTQTALFTSSDEKNKYFSDDGNGSRMKTSESISSEDTVVSRISLEDQAGKFLRQGSQEEQFELPENQLKITPLEEIDDINNMANLSKGSERISEIHTNIVDSSKSNFEILPVVKPIACEDEICSLKQEENKKHIENKIDSIGLEHKQDVKTDMSEKIIPFAETQKSSEYTAVVDDKERSSVADLIEMYDSKAGIVKDAAPSDRSSKSDLGNVDIENRNSVVENIEPSGEKCDNSQENVLFTEVTQDLSNSSPRITEDSAPAVNGSIKRRSDTAKRSDVSDRSSPNAQETNSTSDRPSRHSSKSGVSDLEDEVFLPPSENYIFDGRPVIYCPKIDMSKQVKVEPPKMAMSVFTVVPSKELGSIKSKDWTDLGALGSLPSMKDMYNPLKEKVASPVSTLPVESAAKLCESKDKDGTVASPVDRVSAEQVVESEPVVIHPQEVKVAGNVVDKVNTDKLENQKKQNLIRKASTEMVVDSEQIESHLQGVKLTGSASVQVNNEKHRAQSKQKHSHPSYSKDESKEQVFTLQQNQNGIENSHKLVPAVKSAVNDKLSTSSTKLKSPPISTEDADSKEIITNQNITDITFSKTASSAPTLQFRTKDSLAKGIIQSSNDSKKKSKSSNENIPVVSPGVPILCSPKSGSTFDPFTGDVINSPHQKLEVSDNKQKDSIRSDNVETSDLIKPKLSRVPNLERKDTYATDTLIDVKESPPVKKVEIKMLENVDSVPRETPILSPVSDLPKTTFQNHIGTSVNVVASSDIVRKESNNNKGLELKSEIKKESTYKGSVGTGKILNQHRSKESINSKHEPEIQDNIVSTKLESKSSEESNPEKMQNQSSVESCESTISCKSETCPSSKGQKLESLKNTNWCVGGSLEFLEKELGKEGSRSRKHGSITSAKSEDLCMKCDKASLKSQGSLDKFPHFDHVSAQQKARGARKKILSVDIDVRGKNSKDKSKEMHRSATLPVGSLTSAKKEKEDKKKEKDDKSKKKKKEKEGGGSGEKKSAMLSLKGLLKRNKSKEKEKDKESSQEKLSSPSLFRKFERKSRSNTQSPLLDERKPGDKGKASDSPNRDVDKSRHSPVSNNGKTRPAISSPVSVRQVGKPMDMGVATTIRRSSAALGTSGSDSESPVGSLQSSPKRIISHPRKASLGNQPSPRLYRHVLTRHLSSSQESIDNPLLSSTHSSPQTSPHTSPKRKVMPVSASSYSLPASRDMSPPAPVMGTRALRGSSNSFSVTIGFKPTVEKRNRTMSEGADLNKTSLSPVSKRKEGSRILTQLNKRSSSMEILVCGKIREHCSDGGKSPAGSPFSREGSFRLHREISVETLFELPETSPRSSRTQKDYQEYLEELHARNDSQHGSSCSLFEDSEVDRYSEYFQRRSSHHSPAGKKLSLPHDIHLSGLREIATSNPNLQRSGSPFVRGLPHSSSFTSSPFRRPHTSAAAFSPAKRVMATSAGGPSPPGDVTPGTQLMRVEEEGPCRKNLDTITEKPPNVLIYAANKTEYFTAIKETLRKCLNQDRYTLYQLTDEMAFKSPWPGSTTLLVVCGDVPAHISTAFIRYLLQGGRVLSICSDFLNMAVPLFGTVEVQEQAVVSVSYQQWSGVQLLHHQHCFHSSPQHKRFSREIEKPKGIPNRSAVSVEPTHVEITDEWGGRHRLNLTILATDDTWGAPSLLSARLHGSKGKAVFSQVHLESDPRECFGASEISAKLSSSNAARLEILRDLLSTELSMDTTQSNSVSIFTVAYFLGRHELKQELLSKLKPHMDGQELRRPQLAIQFITSGESAKKPDENMLPVYMNACPMTFSTVKYYEALKTSSFGRLMVYCDVISSTMRVTAGHPQLVNGLVVVATQQSQGKGRGGNAWLSPVGCVMFTIQLHVALSSNLGQYLSFIQHLISIAVADGVRGQPGYSDIPVNLKWPNDIYIGNETKIGGVIVEATTVGSVVIANIGCGVNLSNSNPTFCINDAVRQYNKDNNAKLPEIEREVFLARTFNAFEQLVDAFQKDGPDAVLPKYYKYWLHSNTTVIVQNENFKSESAVITGVDNYGFLEAQLVSGASITLHPDGNSFNMMDGLIYSKYQH